MSKPDWRVERHHGAWAVCEYANGRMFRRIVSGLDEPTARLIAAAHDMRDALADATKAVIAERDCFYDSVTTADGRILEEPDGEELAAADKLIDKCRQALAKAGVS